MKRLLFVDDEPMVLAGLRNLLRSQRHEWEMVFAPSGEAAIAELEKAPFDLIVTDMRMPRMDGNALLTVVRDRWPRMVRIILSGHTELSDLMRSVTLAHQFLSKPCDPEILKNSLHRACQLQDLLNDASLQQVTGAIGKLPSIPRIYLALSNALTDPTVHLDDLASIVEQDVAMCAKLLQIVNSAFFGIRQRITDIHEAIKFLGLSMLKNLVLSIEIFEAFDTKKSPTGLSLAALQHHSLLTAQIAQHLLPARAKDAFMAAMLHDIGLLVLAFHHGDDYVKAQKLFKEGLRPMADVEREVWGANHGEIGGYLLGLWGLPWPIVEAVAFHQTPWQIPPHANLDLPDAVYLADVLVNELGHPDSEPRTSMDPRYLSHPEVAKSLPQWRAFVQEAADQLQCS